MSNNFCYARIENQGKNQENEKTYNYTKVIT